MKTILIPVDFSEPSNNAVNYAVGLSNYQNLNQIILFTNFYVTLFEQIYPSADFIQTNEDDIIKQKNLLQEKLENLKSQILKKLNPGITVKVALPETSLLRGILEIIELENPDVVFLGSNNYDGEISSIGNSMVEIAKVSPVPVFIVPPKATYEPVKNALVACDFRTLNHVSLLHRLHNIKHWPHPKLTLLNVDPANKHLLPEHPELEIKGMLSEILKDYEYELHYSTDKDILNGVLAFADQHNQQIIIALPGVHSFLYTLTHNSITEGLSTDANKPVLILK
nr:universal stress protein [Pedobacter panaciterrae]